MNSIFRLSLLASVAAIALASCSHDSIPVATDTQEEYNREFIKQFGVPMPGHDFSMAITAGLQVTSSTGGHVIVTAEVDGKDYLFADLNVEAGTTPIPVTIPRSVTKLKVKMGTKTIEAGINDLVNLNASDSRTYNFQGTFNGYTAPETHFVSDDYSRLRLAFKPDLIEKFFEKHPAGKESTDYYYQGCNVDEGYLNTNLVDEAENAHIFYGETVLGGLEDLDYYIFPLWWKTNSKGNKNYTFLMHDVYNFERQWQLPFNVDRDSTYLPFPQLVYTERDGIDFDNLFEGYNISMFHGANPFADTSSYPLDETKMVITEGLDLHFNNELYPGYVDYGLGFCLISGSNDYSFSSPMWNKAAWAGGKYYYDESLKHLFFPYVSTMQMKVEPTELHIWRDDETVYEDMGINSLYCHNAFMVGFSSVAPSKAASTDPRDYTDFVMLVVPKKNYQLIYQGDEIDEPYPWTLVAEDLGGTDDWDFNDVVFTFTDVVCNLNTVNKSNFLTCVDGPADATPVRAITVRPLATGGTLPIYITFTGTVAALTPVPEWGDEMYSVANNRINAELQNGRQGTFVLGTEVHKWLGASSHTDFVNVGDVRREMGAQEIMFAIDPGANLHDGSSSAASSENKPLFGFALLVDRENTLGIDALNETDKGVYHLPSHSLGEGTYLIGQPDENGSIAPQMLLLDTDWEWPTERTNIKDAYPQFPTWLSAPESAMKWHHTPASSAHVTSKP